MKTLLTALASMFIPLAAIGDPPEFVQKVGEAIAHDDSKAIKALVEKLLISKGATVKQDCESATIALLAQIDPAFRPDKAPEINIQPPEGGIESAGTDPAGIKDPERRAKYQRAIADARAYATKYQTQKTLCEETIRLVERTMAPDDATLRTQSNDSLSRAVESLFAREGNKVPNSSKVQNVLLSSIKTFRSQ